jgi:hypothetical protein
MAKIAKGDLWNVRKPKGNFVYSGHARNVIIFLQPKLLYRGWKYESTKIDN